VVNVRVHGGTVEAGRATGGTVSGEVKVDDRAVGKLTGARITDGIVHGGRKKSAPVSVVNDTGEKIGTIKGAALEFRGFVAQPKHVPKDSELHAALQRRPGHMESWGIDLAQRPSDAGKHGLGEAWPYYLLVLLVVGTGYFQQKQMTARTPASAQNQQAQMMGRIFPVFFGVISLSIPAGVVVYFIASNLWQIGQQAWIFRDHEARTAAAKPLPSGDGSPARDAKSTETSEKPKPANQQRSNQQRSNRRRKRRR
jgi:OXA1/YqjG-like inner membrane protein